MSRRKLPHRPIEPVITDYKYPPGHRDEILNGMHPKFQAYAEELSIWREGLISLLPGIRKEKKEAQARGDQAELDRLQAEYDEILALLSRS